MLVIAPLNVARTVWAEEAAKWYHTCHLTSSKILGSADERIAALPASKAADLYIINRENVKWLVERYKGKLWPFDMIVIDELSSFKDRSSARWKALVKALPATKRVVGLTGTPSPNGLMDLWSQIYLLDRGQRLGRTLTEYRHKYFTPGACRGRVVYEWRLDPGADEAIMDKLKDLCVSMSAADWLTMPERLSVETPVELPETALSAYRSFAKDFVV